MLARALQGLLACLVLALPSCATYSEHMAESRQAVAHGDYADAMARLEPLLGVGDADALPEDWGAGAALAMLERAILQQAAGRYRESARDFEAADKELELLDIAAGGVGAIGAYIYSDSAKKYRTSPTEKLSLNAFNMLNYLAQGHLAEARVEARRFSVMRNYLNDFDPKHAHGVFGSYLAGFTFERLGEYTSAMRYYDEALQSRGLESLRGPVEKLAALTPYRGRRIGDLLRREGPASDPNRGSPAELIVIASFGRVPYRVPERMAVGAAVGLADAYIRGDTKLLEYAATKVVVYPELTAGGSLFDRVSLEVDGRRQAMELLSDLSAEIHTEYLALRPRILGAAISRMLVRAAVAEGARAAGKQAGSGGELVGLLAALAAEGALVAIDKPDTRSWQFLPARVYAHRQVITPGRHRLQLELRGRDEQRHELTVDVAREGFAVVVITVPR